MDLDRFSQLVERNRSKLQMNQEELGKKVGKTRSTIASYENKAAMPPLNVVEDLAALFKMSPSALVGWNEQEIPESNNEFLNGLENLLKHKVEQYTVIKDSGLKQFPLNSIITIDPSDTNLTPNYYYALAVDNENVPRKVRKTLTGKIVFSSDEEETEITKTLLKSIHVLGRITSVTTPC